MAGPAELSSCPACSGDPGQARSLLHTSVSSGGVDLCKLDWAPGQAAGEVKPERCSELTPCPAAFSARLGGLGGGRGGWPAVVSGPADPATLCSLPCGWTPSPLLPKGPSLVPTTAAACTAALQGGWCGPSPGGLRKGPAMTGEAAAGRLQNVSQQRSAEAGAGGSSAAAGRGAGEGQGALGPAAGGWAAWGRGSFVSVQPSWAPRAPWHPGSWP